MLKKENNNMSYVVSVNVSISSRLSAIYNISDSKAQAAIWRAKQYQTSRKENAIFKRNVENIENALSIYLISHSEKYQEYHISCIAYAACNSINVMKIWKMVKGIKYVVVALLEGRKEKKRK